MITEEAFPIHTKMEFVIDDTDTQDIFNPSTQSNGLDGLFNQVQKNQSSPSANLKYHAPSKKATETDEEPFTVVVNAYAWDGKAYKPVGKLGLALMHKKACMVAFKSKQQVLSSTNLALEPLKIEQHSSTLLGTLDSNVSSVCTVYTTDSTDTR